MQDNGLQPKPIGLKNKALQYPPKEGDGKFFDIDIEKLVLGTYLSISGLGNTLDYLNEDYFYLETHKIIFKAILGQHQDRAAIDLQTISLRLKQQNNLGYIGGDPYLIDLAVRVVSSAHFEYHCMVLYQLYVSRQTALACKKALDQLKYGTHVLDVQDGILDHINNLSKPFCSKETTITEGIKGMMEKLDHMAKGINPGIPTSIEELNKTIGGFEGGQLYTIAGRPGMGKSILGTQLIIDFAKQDKKGVLITLEMTPTSYTTRITSNHCDVDNYYLRRVYNETQFTKMSQNLRPVETMPLWFEEDRDLKRSISRIKFLKARYEIDYVIIDRLCLYQTSAQNREREISNISSSLLALSKELNIPVIAMTQLNRKAEERPNKRPMLSDLRDSGSLEQDSDTVIMLYRPQYYGIDTWEDGSPCYRIEPIDYERSKIIDEQMELIICKNREGATRTIRVGVEVMKSRITNL